jgi:hypothetical protein
VSARPIIPTSSLRKAPAVLQEIGAAISAEVPVLPVTAGASVLLVIGGTGTQGSSLTTSRLSAILALLGL